MKKIRTYEQFISETFGTAHANIPEGIPIKQELQDDLMRRAKQLLGYDVKDLEEAIDKLNNYEDRIDFVIKKLNQSDRKEAKSLATSLLKSLKKDEKFDTPNVDPSRYLNIENIPENDDVPTEDDYEDYLNGLYGSDDLQEDDQFEYLRNKARSEGDEWMYQGNTYGTLLRNYDPRAFQVGYEKYCREQWN